MILPDLPRETAIPISGLAISRRCQRLPPRRSVWSESTKLPPSAPTGFDLFGSAVALSADATVAVISSYASGCSGDPSQCGGARVFASDGGGRSEELFADGFESGDTSVWPVTVR